MASTIKGITVALGGDTTGLVKSFDSLDKKSRNLQSELSQINRLLKFNPDNAALLAQKQVVLAEKVQAVSDKLKLLKDIQADVEREAKNGTLGADQYRAYQREVEQTQSVLQYLDRQIEETDGKFADITQNINGINLGEAERKLADFGGSIKDMADMSMTKLDNLADKFRNVGDKLESVGININTAVSSKVAQKLSEGVTDAMDFEDAMAKVSTIADENEVPMDKLRQQIIDLSNETGVAATDVAENVYNAISAGQKTADAVNFVAQSLSLSKAGFSDTGAALDVLTTIMNAYGMSAEEVGNISDMLIHTQNLGRVTVGELASSMGKVIPTANQYGVSLDQLAAAYSITTAKGIEAAESTTYINSMINELGKSDSKASKVLKESTGKTFTELMGEGKSLSDVLAILQESADENNKSLGDMFGSAEAAKAASTLLGDSANEFNDRLQEMNNSTGATDKALDKLKTTSSDTKKIVNELKNAGIDLGQEVLVQAAPILKEAMDGVKNVTKWLKSLSDAEKKQLARILEIVAVAGPVVTLIGKGYKGIGNLIGIIPKMTAAQKGLNAALDANPIGAVTLAISAFVAVIGGAITAINAFHDAQLEDAGFKQQLDNMQESVDKITEIKDEISATTSDIKNSLWDTSAQIGVIDNYKERLDELLEKATLTPAEQAELITIGDYFSQKYPEFKESWDNYVHVDDDGRVHLSENIDEIKDKLDDLINKYRQVAAQSALSNLAQENAESIVKSNAQLREAGVEYQKALDEYNAFIDEWNLTDENAYKLASAQPWFEWENDDKSKKVYAGDLLNQYNDLTQKMADAQKEYDGVVDSVAQLRVNSEDLSRMQAVVNGNYEDAAAVLLAYNEGMITTNDIENSRWESLDKLKDKAKETSEKTGENLFFGLRGGVDKYKSDIADKGHEMAKEYLDSFDEKMGIESPSKEMYKRGQQTVQGFINGLKDASGMTNIWNAAKSIGSTALNAIKNFLGIHSPSKEAQKIGAFFGEGFSDGIHGYTKEAALSAAELAEAAQKSLKKVNLQSTFSSLSALKNSPYFSNQGTGNISNVTTNNNPTIHVTVNAQLNSDADINALTDRIANQLGRKVLQDGRKWG